MKYRLLILLLASALALPACTLKSSTEAQLERIPLNVEIKLPPGSSRARTATLTSADLPANVSQFTCFGINVTGPGIGPALQSAA